jgi:hypothetical protein
MTVSDEEYWPKKTDKAFKSDGNRDTNVWYGWLQKFNMQEMIADSFKEVADMAVNGVELGPRPNTLDGFLHPIAYLYRHYIELKLKNVLRGGIRLGEITVSNDIMHGHSLHKLWNCFRQLVVKMQMGNDLAPLDNTERIVMQFHDMDRSGQAFRYTTDRDGKPFLEKLPENVGLMHLRDVMAKVHRLLNGCEMCMGAAIDAADEAASYY